MRVLLDSNVLLRAVISPDGPARALLHEVRNRDDHGLVLSEYIIGEVQRILAAPRIRKRVSFADDSLAIFLSEICAVAEIVLPKPSHAIISDANDQPVLDAAITAAVDVICTFDRHFAEPDVQAICARHGIRILDDVALLAVLRGMEV
jgi:putative PIN family toxin of toxin-antitoxin system